MSSKGQYCSPGSKRWLVKRTRERIPVLRWLTGYGSHELISDLIAGITVGLTVMPQSLAYATLAGLEPQYGLYSAFAGCFVYAIFGGIREITIGPTALMSLMTYQQVVGRGPDFAVLLCFLSGIVQILMAILNLGKHISNLIIQGHFTKTTFHALLILRRLLRLLIVTCLLFNNITKYKKLLFDLEISHVTRTVDCFF